MPRWDIGGNNRKEPEKEHFTVKPQATSAVVPAGTIIDVATVHIVASLALLSATL
jgi:hypothetical protein